jgi:hypothetical protein
MKEITVLVADWELQCCGDPFKVGDQVDWSITPWTFPLPPVPEIKSIDYYYDNHSNRDVLEMKGIVTDIYSVYEIYELDQKENVWRPVSGKLEKHNGEANGWESNQGEYRFSSYYVLVAAIAAREHDIDRTENKTQDQFSAELRKELNLAGIDNLK